MLDFIIDKKDYDGIEKRYIRFAARGIAFMDNKLILIKSEKYGEYKFPGGGVHKDEDFKKAVIREYKEETGYDVISIDNEPLIRFKELRKSENCDEIFDHTSYYYLVKVSDEIGNTNLDDYEKEYGYNLVYASIDEAILNNQRIIDNNDIKNIPWIERELFVLKKLKEVYDAIRS